MNVDRPALTALALFGLLGLGFAAIVLRSDPGHSPPAVKKVQVPGTPEILSIPPRVKEVTLRTLHLSVNAPGMSAEEVEKSVAMYLERFLAAQDTFDSVRTVCVPGECRIGVSVKSGVDIQAARSEAVNAIQSAIPFLPPDASPPVVLSHDPDLLPTFWVAVSSDVHPESVVTDILKSDIRDKLYKIPGIAEVVIRGGVDRVTTLHIDPQKLEARGLTQTDVTDALAKVAIEKPQVKVEDLEDTVVSTRNSMPIRLRDVAALNRDGIRRTEYVRHGGQRCTLAGIFLMEQGGEREAVEAIRTRLKELPLPDGVRADLIVESSERILVSSQFPQSSRIEDMEKTAGEIERRISEVLPPSEIGPLLTLVLDPHRGESTVRMFVPLADGHTQNVGTIQERIRSIAGEFPQIRMTTRRLNDTGQPDEPIRVRLIGKELASLRSWSDGVLREAAKPESGLVDLAASGQGTTREIRLMIDRNKAATMGLSARDIYNVFQQMMRPRSFQVGKTSIWILAGLTGGGSITRPEPEPEDIGLIPIPVPDTKRVLLRDVAKLEWVESPAIIERFNVKRCVTITANPTPSVSLETAKSRLRKIAEDILENMKLPKNYEVAVD